MSIRRLIELVIDRNAARRAERETQESLAKGTDPKVPGKNLRQVGASLEGLKSIAQKLGLALGAAFVIRKIKDFGKEAVRVATEARGVWNRLAGQLETTGTEFAAVEGEITRTARALQDASTVGDEDFAAVLTELVGITGDYKTSLKEVETVANLAAAKQIDLRTAAQLVGRVMVGETGTLSRYGIIVQEGADAMDVLRSRFAGMARNEARELEGQTKMLGNEMSDLKQAIGDAMIETAGGAGVLQTMIAGVKGLTIWLNENRAEVVGWGQVVVRSIGAAYESIRFVVRALFNFGQVVGSGFELAMLELQRVFGPALNRLADLIDKIPGIDIPIRMNELTPEEYWAENRRLTDAIKRDTTDLADSVWDLGDAYLAVGTAAHTAATGQTEVSTPGVTPTPGSGSSLPGLTGPALPTTGQMWERFNPLEGAEDRLRESTREMLQGVYQELETNPFALLMEQVDVTAAYMRQGFAGVGHAIVSELVAGRAEEQFAAGMAALASGLWPPNPAALGAAAKHFAAAALYRKIGSMVAGGGGGSRVPTTNGLTRGGLAPATPTAQPLGAEVHIYLDPLSPGDQRFQRASLGAVQNAIERFGENVRVNVHPRTAS